LVGKTLGPYKIIEQLGAGGMGEVYLAEDTRLGRKVAVKVLPAEFAGDAQRLARFEQEARAAAALNHPHIAMVHDVGADEGDAGDTVHYIVQEHLEGTTLREALAKGALAPKKTLALAVEIVEALGAAHAAGIVHRDLKPDNVFVTKDGHAKVLDFGLAKLTEIAAPGGAEISMSPTVLGTVAGQIMGTAGYMSPEQVEGDGDIDGRADLFAFGCVLYEMATGKRAFGGKSVLDTLHAIARTDPQPFDEIKPDAPAELGRILGKCLAKERERRYQHADDLLVDLRALAAEVDAGTAPSFAAAAAAGSAAPPTRKALPLLAAGFVAGAVLATLAVVVSLRPGTTTRQGVERFEIDVSQYGLDQAFGPAVFLSPDGSTLAYNDADGLWVRRLDDLAPRHIVENGIDNPVFSPDGQWIAYEQSGTVWRIPVTGGSPLPIIEASSDRGTFWGEPDAILLTPEGQGPIFRVRIGGSGEPEPVTELTGDDVTHRWPQLLPGGKAVLFTAHTRGNGAFEDANIMVRDLTSGEQRVVFRGGYYARYAPTGHLLYANGAAVFAAPFDVDRLEVTGTSVPVLENVRTSSTYGAAQYSFLNDGTLVYVRAEGEVIDTLSWLFLDAGGNAEETWMPNDYSFAPALSPDGSRLAVAVRGEEGEYNLWVWDRARAAQTRITFSEAEDLYPVWMPGGRELILSSDRDGQYRRLYRVRADGSARAQPLIDEPEDGDEIPFTVSADGRWLLTGKEDASGQSNVLRVHDLTGGDSPRVVLDIDNRITSADLSPDAGWIAYASDESGDWEVYAVPFLAEDGDKVTVSVGGGGMPRWSADGRRIYYRSPEGVAVVDMNVEDGRLQPGLPQLLFEGTFVGGPVGYPYRGEGLLNFEAAGDGDTFVLQQSEAGSAQTKAIIVFNWFDELKRLVPTGR